MKAWKRVLIKTIIFLVVVAVAGGGAAGFRAYQQSTSEYAAEEYLSLLIENRADKAYALLDQSEDGTLSAGEYAKALEAKKYSLASKYKAEEMEKRRDSEGHEYVDYHVSFFNAADEVQFEEDFVVKKQAEATFGIFDTWKVLSGHCMVRNFRITVPAGSQLYLNNEEANREWITREEIPASYDCYQIPSLLPGKIAVVVRHPALESVNTTADTADGSVDYTGKMTLKKSAQDTCKELGVKALKQLYAAAAKNEKAGLDAMFDACKKDAKKFVSEQGGLFNQEGRVFKNAAISDFAPQFGDIVFTEEVDGAITTEMTFSYHYVVREDVVDEAGEVLEDGTPVQQTGERSGDNTAKFVMSFADGEWKIASLELPVIPQEG